MSSVRWRWVLASLCALAISACTSGPEPAATLPDHCVPITGERISGLIDEYPLDLLAEDVRGDLREALRGASRVCLVAEGETVQCNAGGGPKPDIRRCCRFRTEPAAAIFGVARRIGISRDGSQVLDLAVEPSATNTSIDRQCDVPTCADDRASGDATLTLRGAVKTKDGAVEFELPMALDGQLGLSCTS